MVAGKRVLVTGGAGFIGSHVDDLLASKGFNVIVLDDLSTGRKENLEQVADSIAFVEGSILDRKLLEAQTKGIDAIVHLAAKRSVIGSLESPLEYNEVNVGGTLQVLEAARENGVKRIVFASSSSVYGDSERLPQKETDTAKPKCPYALTKWIGEHYLRIYHSLFGLETISLRFFNVFGPRQPPNSKYAAVIPLFVSAFLDGKQPTIFGDGKQSRDFTFVEDTAESCLAALETKNGGCFGQAFNIARGKDVCVLELAEKIGALLEKQVEPVFAPIREHEAKHTRADASKAKELLGFECEVPFEKGLEETVGWFLDSKKAGAF